MPPSLSRNQSSLSEGTVALFDGLVSEADSPTFSPLGSTPETAINAEDDSDKEPPSAPAADDSGGGGGGPSQC